MLTLTTKIAASIALVATFGGLIALGDLPWWEPLGVMVLLLIALWVS